MSLSMALKTASNGSQDIYLDENGQIAFVTGQQYTAQRIKTRLQLFLGEWAYDTSQGVPWLEVVFAKPADIVTIEAVIKNTILETPNVISLLSYSDQLVRKIREYIVQFSANTTEGTIEDTLDLTNILRGKLHA
jgi:hypothetical protein